MDTISLTHEFTHNITILSNDFIDRYMCKAEGEYVKIYLLILRFAGQGLAIDPDQLADRLDLTRKDVMRAIKYWEKQGLLSLQPKETAETDLQNKSEVKQEDHPLIHRSAIPKKRIQDAKELDRYISSTEMRRLVFMAETYIGHPLSISELNSIYYISNDLHFSTDLLEYLVEYCSEKGKKQIRYIEKVALNWYEQGIDTVSKAMDQTALYGQNVFLVMRAFGISGRNPGQPEIDYINRWNDMGFGSDIIMEACNRTLIATHQASFPYANRILEDWKRAGVTKLSDIRSIDKLHQSRTGNGGPKSEPAKARKGSANAFHNFEQRSYDYEDLESRLVSKNRR